MAVSIPRNLFDSIIMRSKVGVVVVIRWRGVHLQSTKLHNTNGNCDWDCIVYRWTSESLGFELSSIGIAVHISLTLTPLSPNFDLCPHFLSSSSVSMQSIAVHQTVMLTPLFRLRKIVSIFITNDHLTIRNAMFSTHQTQQQSCARY